MSNYKDLSDRNHKYLRYLLVLSFITCVVLFAARAAHGAWYDANWQYRKKITIQSSRVTGGPHSNFPVLISLSADAELAANARNDGYDILFTSNDELTKIAHEREKFDGGTGELIAWVKVGSVSSSGDTDIYMYYGNLSAGDQQLVAPTKSVVWSDYEGVWHLNESVSDETTTGTHYDSTTNNNHGTQNNNNSATGKIAGGQDFDGNNDYISVTSNASLQPTTVVTLSGWIKLRTFGSGDEIDPIIRKGESNDNNYQLTVDDSKAQLVLDGGDGETILGTTTLSADSWYYIVGTWQSGGQRVVYLNGSTDGNPGSFTGPIGTDTRAFYMGGRAGSDYSDSILDEVRISKSLRSAQWIQTEYNNQVWPNTADTPNPLPNPNPGGGFIMVFSEVSGGGGGNTPPNVNAGSDDNVTLPNIYNLNGTADSGGDGPTTPPNVTWTMHSGPGSVTFGDPNAQDTTAEFSMHGTYVLRLEADDGTDTVYDEVTITVYPAGGAPPVGDYSCYMKITIDSTKVEGTSPHYNFPVLITLTEEPLKTTGTGCGFVTSSAGDDIIFTNESKTVQLYHEIEEYDGSSGKLVAWVNIPTLSNTTDTVIYAYYGNSGVSGPQENPADLWNTSVYEAVYHLNDDFQDSTSNNRDATAEDTNGGSGKIEGGEDFGPQDRIDVGAWSVGGQGLTMQAWARFDDFAQDDPRVMDKANGSSAEYHVFMLGLGGTGDQYLRMRVKTGTSDSSGTTTIVDTDDPVSEDTWHLVAGTYDGSNMRLLLDGVEVHSAAKTGNLRENSWDVALGDQPGNASTTTYSMDGKLDEVRILSVARSADWLRTEYNNQNDPSSFYTVDPAQCPDNTPPISEFACNIPITINSSQVSGTSDLINFPVLIDITNSSLKTSSNCGYVEDSNGYDIIFSDATQTVRLDHELEDYSGWSGRLRAWVRIPTLSVESDTTIYVHFGHSSVCGSLENPAGVWDSNYVGVWHFKETTGTHYDSTSYGTNGTPGGGVIQDAVGKIGGADDFDGIDDHVEIGTTGFTTTNMTLTAWVKADALADHRYMFGHTTQPAYANRIQIYTNGIAPTVLGLGLGDTHAKDTGSALSAGSWYHVALVKDATNYWVYLNSALDMSGTYTGFSALQTYADIGNDGNPSERTESWNGVIDEVRISNVARSAGWIQTSYNNQEDPGSFISVGTSSCWLGGFSCNRKITIDSSKVAGTSNLTDFPLLVKIENDCNLKSEANGGIIKNSNGWDIIFLDSDGLTQLDHEIEKYDGTDGDLISWVRIPSLPDDTDKEIYMYYGNSSVACDPSNPTGVWDSRYRAVYHLHDDFNDSTQYNRDGTNYGTTFTTGIIGNGALFTPSDGWDRIELGTWSVYGDDLTIQAWAWPNDFNQDDPRIVSKGSPTAAGTQDHVFQFGLQDGDPGLENRMRIRVKTGTLDTAGTVQLTGSSPNGYLPSAQTWYFLAATYEEDNTGDEARLFRNEGLNAGTLGNASTESLRANSWPVWIGASPYGSSNTVKTWDGILDEVRILSNDLSQSWLETEYNNVSDPDSFYTMSQDTCGGTYGFSFKYCRKITVDHTQVNSDLTDFPLLVNITGEDDLKTVANGGHVEHSQGWDIVFKTDGCGTLDHEIEKYDGSTGDLVAWVRVPTLSSSTDTEIYMYYGASPVLCSPENPDGVWDDNYVGVWHLSEEQAGTGNVGLYQDSTSNENDGDDYVSATGQEGQIDGGQQFDGTDDFVDSGNNSSLDVDYTTIEFWLKVNSWVSNGGILAKGTSSTRRYWIWTYGGAVSFEIDEGTLQNNAWNPTAGQWEHLVLTYDGTNVITYRNGGIETNTYPQATGTIDATTEPLLFGDIPGFNHADVNLDEVRISDTARSADWIDAQYKNHTNANFYSITSCFEQTTQMTEAWEEDFQ